LAYFGLLAYTLILFVRPQDWIPGIQGLPLLDSVVAGTMVFWLMAVSSRETLRPGAAPQTKLMVGFFLATLMSHVRHTYLGSLNGGGLLGTFVSFSKVLLLYILIVTLVNSIRRAKKLVFVMTLGCLFMTIHGILQAHRGFGFGGGLPIYQDGIPRVMAFGIFNDPNDLALILIAVLPFLMSKVQDKLALMPARFLSALAIVPMIYCIFLTNSRGGWLAFGVMVTTYVCLRARSKKLAIVLGALAFAVVILFGPSRMGGSSLDRSAQGRLTAWGYGNRMLKRWPLFGAGKGRYTEFSDDGRVAHNSFVHCWGELGLFGYFFFVGLIIATLKDGRALMRLKIAPPEDGALPENREYANSPKDVSPPENWDEADPPKGGLPATDLMEIRRFGHASMASLSGYLAAGMFLSRTYTHPLYILFALVAALRVVCDGDLEEGPSLLERTFGKPDLKHVFLATILTVPAFWFLMKLAL